MWLHTINIYDTQYLTSLSEQHPLNCTTENASGSLGLKKNQRIQESVGLGSLPSPGGAHPSTLGSWAGLVTPARSEPKRQETLLPASLFRTLAAATGASW